MVNAANWTARLRALASRAGVPGATLGIWFDGQEVVAAHGVLNCATGVPVTEDSLFQIGSITKIWTATMVMQLVDEGLLSLDTTVAEALPGIRLGAADVGGQVTIQHLLTHTSGIDGDIFTDTGRGDDCVRRYVGELARASSTFPAGTAYSYCNSAFVLLGRIIEVLDDRSWDTSLRERLIGPLALTQTVTLPEEAILHRAAVGHHDGRVPVQTWGLPRSVGPAGLITATASDLLTFARLHLDGGVAPHGKRLLSEDSVAAMQQPRAAIPEFASPGAAIGLGWRLGSWSGRPVLGHDGDTVGQSAYLRIDPEARVAACLLTNTAESESLFRGLFDEVFGDLLGVTMPAAARPAPVPYPGSDPPALQHAGRYERTSRRIDVSVRDGQLRMVPTMTGKLADLIDSEPQELILHPVDASGRRFVMRSREEEPWVPLSFGRLADHTPYLYLGGRVTPRVG
ncbi:MAG: beta-lactamase family protein [Actinomycetota bacterium]|nr:beta-lactamase family protein [Actinomycetota bacterium]